MNATRIYFVATLAAEQRNLLCEWVESLYGAGKRVLVLADSTIAAQHLDQLLWTFSQGSFIPHRLMSRRASATQLEPVVVAAGEVPHEGFDAVVCDVPAGLEYLEGFSIVVHFVISDDAERRQGSRLLWQKARDRGLELQHIPQREKPPQVFP